MKAASRLAAVACLALGAALWCGRVAGADHYQDGVQSRALDRVLNHAQDQTASRAQDRTPNRAQDRGQSRADSWVEVRSAHFVVSSNAGEMDARHIAEQFEQMRAMVHATFATLRVDPGQPIAILAARDESTMKLLLPEEWAAPGHVHPTGLFQSGDDKDYVVMRLDAPGANAFHTVYHEYTHALLHLNFGRLPLWFEEGLAEFFGNSSVGEKDAKTGTIDKTHVYFLNHSELLPMEVLLQVNNDSPYYNETNRVSIFYAESWAVVHYLLLDPEARQKQLLARFLSAWEKSGNSLEAAREAFGDLPRFGETIKRYAHQEKFRAGLGVSPQQEPQAQYAVRTLSPGEVLALRGDFFVHRNLLEQARPLLEEAVQLEPSLATTHEALGFYEFRERDFAAADEQMTKAIELGSTSFIALYCRGLLLLREVNGTDESTQRAARYLERAARINPRFAPIFEALTQAYSRSAETQKQALEAATRAVQIDPTSRSYATNLIYALLNNNRPADARAVGQKLLASASSAEETRTARAVLDRIEEEEEWLKESQEEAESAANASSGAPGSGMSSAAGSTVARPEEARRRLPAPASMAVDGAISAADCSLSPEVRLTLSLAKGPMSFRAADLRRVGLSGVSEQSTPSPESCRQWAGRRVKIWFRLAPGDDYLGEIIKIYFY
jgi:tetratricopeptide (TPR) repeat protein